MIYIFADMYSFRKEVSQNRLFMLEFLGKENDMELISNEIPFQKEVLKKEDKILYFMIRTFSHPSVRFIERMIHKTKDMDCEKYIYIEDFYESKKIHQFCTKYKLENIIYSMNHDFYKKKLLNLNSNYNIYTLHHHFHLYMFPDKIPEKKYDILLYGFCSEKQYPLRVFFKNVLEKYKDKYRIKIIPLPHYKLKSWSVIGNQLYNEISKSYITVATTSKYDFFLKKYQEIPLCGSMIMGNIPTNYSDIYTKDTIINIERKDENEIIKKIEDSLSNKKELLEKTRKLQNKMREMFCMKNVVKELKTVLR
jgi:SpoVK/Ycf46/Vps4 family AAA+-type ATPase